MLTFEAANLSDLQTIAHKILNQFSELRVFALKGVMGAGKTTLIKELCHVLGVKDVVVSPTFALINEYHDSEGESVFHFDFYRIRSISEAFDLGYEEYFYSGSYCFIEWPEKVEQLLPSDSVYINIDVNNENLNRTIMVQ